MNPIKGKNYQELKQKITDSEMPHWGFLMYYIESLEVALEKDFIEYLIQEEKTKADK